LIARAAVSRLGRSNSLTFASGLYEDLLRLATCLFTVILYIRLNNIEKNIKNRWGCGHAGGRGFSLRHVTMHSRVSTAPYDWPSGRHLQSGIDTYNTRVTASLKRDLANPHINSNRPRFATGWSELEKSVPVRSPGMRPVQTLFHLQPPAQFSSFPTSRPSAITTNDSHLLCRQ